MADKNTKNTDPNKPAPEKKQRRKSIPIVSLDNFGHTYPIAPLPMHREVTLRCRRSARGKPRVTIDVPWSQWAQR